MIFYVRCRRCGESMCGIHSLEARRVCHACGGAALRSLMPEYQEALIEALARLPDEERRMIYPEEAAS